MENDINYWFRNKNRLINALFRQHFYGVGGETSIGNFWQLVVRPINNKVACGCDWCARIHNEMSFLAPRNAIHSFHCRLTESINLLLEKFELPILNPWSGCILDPSGEGDFFLFEKNMLESYIGNIENQKKFNIFIHKVEAKWIEYMDTFLKLENGEGGENCCVCLEHIEENAKKLVCSHTFHENCIRQWLKIKRNCPLCRYSLKEKADKALDDWLFSHIREE